MAPRLETPPRRVFISYRHVDPDPTVARELAGALQGHAVLIDTTIPLGTEWGEVVEENLADADFLIALVSAAAAASPMVTTEIAEAHRLNVERQRPTIIPVRLGDGFRLRYPLSAYVSRFQQATWNGPEDTQPLIARVLEALAAPPRRVHPAADRLQLIQRVRGDWIKGLLEKSLYQIARIELGLTVDQTAVVRGLDMVVQRPEEASQPLQPGTPLVDLFDDHRGQLLILGAPGAGKTTLLLELARELLWRSRRAPWNYASLLDAAADRILMRKVGGGYIFVHRLLMEYLASEARTAWDVPLAPPTSGGA